MEASSTSTKAARKRRVHRRVSSYSTDSDIVGHQQQQHDAKRTQLVLLSPPPTGGTSTTTIDQAPAVEHADDDGPSRSSSSMTTMLPSGIDVPSSSAAAEISCIKLPRTVSAVAMAEHHPQQHGEEEKFEDKIMISNIKKHASDVLSAPGLCPSIISSRLSTITLSSLDSNGEGSSSSSSRSCSPALSSGYQVVEGPTTMKPSETIDDSTPRSIPKHKSKPRFYTIVVALVLSGLAWMYAAATTGTKHPVEPGSVYVPGAGFSGFWYTLGRLRSIPDPSAHNFYCYSAGCLGVVAALNGLDMEEVYDAAASMQTQWKNGDISRYDVVGGFVDYLLDRVSNNETAMDLSLLNVLTTAKDGWFGVRLSVQTPSNLENLRTLLLQTTWIPYAVGDGLWHHGHMDGGATALFHPKCEVQLDLPLDLDLLGNIVNVNLGRDKVFQFWEKGLAQGL